MIILGVIATDIITIDTECLENEFKEADPNDTYLQDTTSLELIKHTWTASYGLRQQRYPQKSIQLIEKLQVLKSQLCPEFVIFFTFIDINNTVRFYIKSFQIAFFYRYFLILISSFLAKVPVHLQLKYPHCLST